MNPIEEISQDLRRIGLKKGDTVLVRAAAKALKVDRNFGSPAKLLYDAVLNVVGNEGTIIGLSFSRQDAFWNKPSDYTFGRTAKTTSGAFTQMMVDMPHAKRSKHPTSSFVATGAYADEIIAGHDEKTTSFHPVRKIIELNGKMLLVGCVQASPGFSTAHLAQEDLGLATKTPLRGFGGAFFINDAGNKQWFGRKDVAGCSRGFWKAYDEYVRAGVLFTGHVCGAYSAFASAKDCFAIERDILARNPRALLCDNLDCVTCATRTYNLRAWPMFAIKGVSEVIRLLGETTRRHPVG